MRASTRTRAACSNATSKTYALISRARASIRIRAGSPTRCGVDTSWDSYDRAAGQTAPAVRSHDGINPGMASSSPPRGRADALRERQGGQGSPETLSALDAAVLVVNPGRPALHALARLNSPVLRASGEVEAIEVHDLGPRGDEVLHKRLLRVVTCIDFRDRPELGVRAENEVGTGGGPLDL